jgi:outer membrane receptor for ferrienterochelin and colicins
LKFDRLAAKTDFSAKNTDGNAVRNPYSDYSLAQGLKYTFNDRSDAEIKGQYYRGETWFLDKFQTRIDENYTLNGKWRYQFSSTNELILAANTDIYDGHERFVGAHLRVRPSLQTDSTRHANSSSHSTIRLTDMWHASERLQIVSGTELNWETTFSNNQFSTSTTLSDQTRSANNQNIFTQAEYKLDFIDILAGARYTHHSQFDSHFSPKISLMKQWEDFRFRGTVSNGYKVPTLKELYMNFLHPIDYVPFWVVGNADLKPEIAWYESLSAEYLTNDINVSATVYTNQITNRINAQRLWNEAEKRAELRYENIEKARISGIDIAAHWTINQHIAIKSSYSYTDATRRGGVRPPNNNHQLPGNSRHTATLNVTFTHKKQSVVVSTRARSPFTAVYPLTPEAMLHPDETRVNGYWISNLVYNLQLSRDKWRGHLQIGINNVLDYKNQDALPGNSGRVCFVGMGVNFL